MYGCMETSRLSWCFTPSQSELPVDGPQILQKRRIPGVKGESSLVNSSTELMKHIRKVPLASSGGSVRHALYIAKCTRVLWLSRIVILTTFLLREQIYQREKFSRILFRQTLRLTCFFNWLSLSLCIIKSWYSRDKVGGVISLTDPIKDTSLPTLSL